MGKTIEALKTDTGFLKPGSMLQCTGDFYLNHDVFCAQYPVFILHAVYGAQILLSGQNPMAMNGVRARTVSR